MPELPEAETIARQLRSEVVGAVIEGVSVRRERSVRGHSPARFRAALRGARIRAVERRGKWPVLVLDGERFLVVRLGMSGRLLLSNCQAPEPKWVRVSLRLSGGRVLRFVDPRAFGWVSLESGACFHSLPAFERLGPEPLAPDWSAEQLRAALAGRRAGLEKVLLDGRAVAGIGKIYADEICFRARIHPETPAGDLTGRQVERLHQAIRQVLSAAIRHCGTSAADRAYVDFYGRPGSFQNFLNVYQRTGMPCRVCGARIRRVPLGRDRGIHYCPRCQRKRA